MKKSKDMKIGIDISQIVYKGSGVSRFTEGLVNVILDHDKKNEWIFFFSSFRNNLNPILEKEIINNNFQLNKYKFPPTFFSLIWNDYHIINIEKFLGNLDWFITSDWTEAPTKCKKATIVHDLTFIRFPETVDEKIRITQEKRLNWVKKESDIIFADSEATKIDLVNYLKVDEAKIFINYPGSDITIPKPDYIKRTLDKFNLKKKFILTVGKIEPRKNLKRLIDAFKQLNSETINLIIVGPSGWGKIEDLPNNVRLLGYVNDRELSSLYMSCLFFIYPSIWEGFGYPLVEAMKFGTPAATSNNSSLKEIASDSALLFNPFDTNEIKKSLEKMINDESLRKKLSEKGKARGKIFTWENYYNKLIDVLSL